MESIQGKLRGPAVLFVARGPLHNETARVATSGSLGFGNEQHVGLNLRWTGGVPQFLDYPVHQSPALSTLPWVSQTPAPTAVQSASGKTRHQMLTSCMVTTSTSKVPHRPVSWQGQALLLSYTPSSHSLPVAERLHCSPHWCSCLLP